MTITGRHLILKYCILGLLEFTSETTSWVSLTLLSSNDVVLKHISTLNSKLKCHHKQFYRLRAFLPFPNSLFHVLSRSVRLQCDPLCSPISSLSVFLLSDSALVYRSLLYFLQSIKKEKNNLNGSNFVLLLIFT